MVTAWYNQKSQVDLSLNLSFATQQEYAFGQSNNLSILFSSFVKEGTYTYLIG